jgi:hypothetical protein
VLALLLAGCASGSPGAGGRGHGTAAPPAARLHPVATSAPRNSSAITARVVLPSKRMTAGSSMAVHLQRFTIPVGQTSYRVTLRASYSQCSQGRPRSRSG